MQPDDSGTVPRAGTLCASPDIIPYGTVPVNDPVTFFTNNYSQDVGQVLTANQQNYIYARAYNYATGPQSGSIFLYYSPAALLLYPSMWSGAKKGTGYFLADAAKAACSLTFSRDKLSMNGESHRKSLLRRRLCSVFVVSL
jgi:hypothetical protein